MTRSLAPRTIRLLDTALICVRSVDYKVSLRWVFYRLMNILGLTKKDYSSFKSAASMARKRRIRGWHPSTLADESRSIYYANQGYSSIHDWVDAVKKGIACNLDKHIGQKNRVIVCFEAKAMLEQFKRYTAPYYVDLVPFGGDLSIPIKQEIADLVTRLAKGGKPVILCYFGDLDRKGEQIPLSAMVDIRKWTSCAFNYVRIGLDRDHVAEYHIPENPEKPGEYQWEALPDEAAAKLITNALEKYLDLNKIRRIIEVERKAEAYLAEYLREWRPQTLITELDLGTGGL